MAASRVISVPAISARFRILDLIDNDYFKNVLGVDLESRHDHGFDSQYYYETLSRLKISDLFSATPEPQSILEPNSSCLLRFPPQSFGASFDAEECCHEIDVKKYIQRDFVCYELTPLSIWITFCGFFFEGLRHQHGPQDSIQERFKNETFEDTHSFIVLIHTLETKKF